MDNGDRSGRDDEPDREAGSAGNGEESGGHTRDAAPGDDVTEEDITEDEPTPAGPAYGSSGDEVAESEEGADSEEVTDSEEVVTDSEEVAESEGGADSEEVADSPANRGSPTGDGSATDNGLLYRFRNDMDGPLMWIREMLSSVAIVLLIGLLLFGVSGVWPPMVAVESGSMEPNMEVGDLVFVTEPGRLAPDAAQNEVGVVTHAIGERVDYRTFGSYGSVVIYRPPGRTASPIIHRAMFRVEAGENWYDRADDQYHSAADCGELTHCPAPHDGFITLGDNNGQYDQANGLAAPVKADWVTGVARVRVPYLGYVRLIATGQAELRDVVATTGPIATTRASVRHGDAEDGFDEGLGARDAEPVVSGGDVAAVVAG